VYVDPYLKEMIERVSPRKSIKVFSRSSTILPEYEHRKFLIYTGKTFVGLKVTGEMVNKKFGEYAPTKLIGKLIHTVKRKKKKKKKKKR
jgi:small subunit ribosomal protein S19